MTNTEKQIWELVHNWCNEQLCEIPDFNRRVLMDRILALCQPLVVRSLPSDDFLKKLFQNNLNIKNMYYLMNSTVMPTRGLAYFMQEVSEDKFMSIVRREQHNNNLTSCIGYAQNSTYITKKAGVQIVENRVLINAKPGDTLLMMRVPNRLSPEQKRRLVDERSFYYYVTKVFSINDEIMSNFNNKEDLIWDA